MQGKRPAPNHGFRNPIPDGFTDEQLEGIRCPATLTGNELVVFDSYAGTGKTKTCAAFVAHRKDVPMFLYWVYNRAPRLEAERKFRDIPNVTVHNYLSLAWEWIVNPKQGYKLASKETGQLYRAFREVVEVWVNKQAHLTLDGYLSAKKQKRFFTFTMMCLSQFAQSGHTEVSDIHAIHLRQAWAKQVARDELAGPVSERMRRNADDRWLPGTREIVCVCNAVVQAIVTKAITAINFEFALKLMHLTKPDLSAKYSVPIVDEAQDLPAVVIAILRQYNWSIVLFGDEQQGINRWMGACDAMNYLRSFYPADRRWEYILSQSFRFSLDVANGLANKLFQGILPLKKPVGSAAKHKTVVSQIKLDATQAANTPIGPAEMAMFLRRMCILYPDHTHGLLSRTKLTALEIIEHLTIGVDVSQSGKQTVSYCCCSSLQTTLRDLIKLARQTNDQLQTRIDRAIEEEQMDVVRTCQYLLEKKNRWSYADRLQLALTLQSSAATAKLHIFTAHSSKGLEWDHVYVADDFDYSLCKLHAFALQQHDIVTDDDGGRRSFLIAAPPPDGPCPIQSMEQNEAGGANEDAAEFDSHCDKNSKVCNNTTGGSEMVLKLPRDDLALVYVTYTRPRHFLYLPPAQYRFYESASWLTWSPNALV